jgi:predicted Mrr-cat superfamily restriction endonuclease
MGLPTTGRIKGGKRKFMMNGWILRPYPHGINRIGQFLAEGFVAIGWPGIGDLYSCDRSGIYQKVSALYISDYGDKFCRESSNTLHKFRDEIQIGEIVLAVPFSEDSLEVAVAKVDSSYFFDARYDETVSSSDTGHNGFSHRRRVIWLEKRLPRSLLPESVKKNFTKQILTTLNLEGYNRLIELLESRGHNLKERWEMSQHRKQLIDTSTKMVLQTLQQKMPELAELFDRMAKEIFEIFDESESIHFDLLTSRLLHAATSTEAHLIPIDVNDSCRKLCISMALDKWDSAHGFCEIAKQTMTYWLECLDENSQTIFFTSAWDEADFLSKFKTKFDAYAKRHQVAIILITSNGFLLTYLWE